MTKQQRTHDAEVTKNTKAISWSHGAIDMKSELYLRIMSALCKACSFTVFCQKKCHKKKKKKVTPGWTDISDPGPVSFLSRSSMYYITLTLQNPIKPLNIFSTNSFSGGPNFASAIRGVQRT